MNYCFPCQKYIRATAIIFAVLSAALWTSASRRGTTLAQSGGTKPAAKVDYATLTSGLRFRSIGPAVIGGRVDDFAVVESDPSIVYAGTASGGIHKTTNGGTTWTPIFDNEEVSSIGDITLVPSDPAIVWVGTGEPNNRQSSSWGNVCTNPLTPTR